MIEVKEIKTKKGMTEFVKFPFSLYKNNSYWVPPIIADEVESFNPEKNPVFKHSSANYFIAYKNGKAVGRVAAIINRKEIEEQQVKKMRFGWFDVIDDIEVTKALLNKVTEIGKANNLEFVEGPVGFSNLDKVGVLVEGFDHIGTMITWYNHPYYKVHLEQLGYKKAKEYLEHVTDFTKIDISNHGRMAKLIAKRYNVKLVTFKKSKDVLPYVEKMFELFNTSYSSLASFVPISKDQQQYFKDKYINLIDPQFINFVVDKDNELVAFAITLPSFAKALQKANGKLFPLGIFHLLKAKKKSDKAILYLIGVHPKYQNKGLTAIIMKRYYDVYAKKGIKQLIRTPELAENAAANKIWRVFNQTCHKRRRTYKKFINS